MHWLAIKLCYIKFNMVSQADGGNELLRDRVKQTEGESMRTCFVSQVTERKNHYSTLINSVNSLKLNLLKSVRDCQYYYK